MENSHDATTSIIVLKRNRLLPTSPVACLFVSYGCMEYGIFTETAELIAAVFQETAKVPLSIGSGDGGGGERKWAIYFH